MDRSAVRRSEIVLLLHVYGVLGISILPNVTYSVRKRRKWEVILLSHGLDDLLRSQIFHAGNDLVEQSREGLLQRPSKLCRDSPDRLQHHILGQEVSRR